LLEIFNECCSFHAADPDRQRSPEASADAGKAGLGKKIVVADRFLTNYTWN